MIPVKKKRKSNYNNEIYEIISQKIHHNLKSLNLDTRLVVFFLCLWGGGGDGGGLIISKLANRFYVR